MDNQTHNSENAWVETKVSRLAPASDWYPNSKRAYAEFLNRRERQGADESPRWIRLSMAAAILASIGLVVTLLPWQALWKPGAEDNSRLTAGPVKPRVPEPAPAAVAAVQQLTHFPPKQDQKPVEQFGQDEVAPQGIGTEGDPNYSDEARRAHIQGTVAVVQQTSPPAHGQEEKPAERIGPGVTPPRIIGTAPEPNYTDEARQAHVQGTIILGVIIRTDGTGKVEKVVRGLGYGLDEKAIEDFEKWRFEPATKDGKPVAVQLQVTINYRLY
jgi:TonB family protein